jgi:tetratricopeptide (TPR) repeat protein
LAYAALNRHDEALTYYQQAVRYNPDDVWFWHNYGDAWMMLDNCERAVETFKRALELDPNHEPTMRKLKLAQECVEDDQ